MGFIEKKLVGTGSGSCSAAIFDTSGVGNSCHATEELVKEKGDADFEIYRNSAAEDSALLEYVTSLSNLFPPFRGHCISSTRPGPII